MDEQDYRQNITIQYCFPDNNRSCVKEVIKDPGYFLMCFILSCISVCTVFLNLLVIISISHFKQLHTPTNLLILSLAVADFLVGLFNMPLDLFDLMDSCWYLGTISCDIRQIIALFSKYGSLYSVILIAVDRYVAITAPLQYSSKITLHKTLLSIIVAWCFCLYYAIMYVYFNVIFLQPQISTHCYGQCVMYVNHSWAIFDLVIAFLAPCCLIFVLYSVIFKVAIHQAKAIRAVNNCPSNSLGAKMSKASEIKAVKKLGTVVFVYLACWIPLYISSVSIHTSLTVWTVLIWILNMNSFVNPLIYAIFYSWFSESAKNIVTCRIFKPSSSRLNLFPKH